MNDIFALDEADPQVRLVALTQSVKHLDHKRMHWVAYFAHPSQKKTTRVEIRQDLLADWSVTRHTVSSMTRKSFSNIDDACALALRWILKLEKNGMLKTLSNSHPSSVRLNHKYDPDWPEPEWIEPLLAAFTLHNDWVDLATCLSMSADEYVDANWRRFRDWLVNIRQCQHSDREVFQFGFAIWRAYRQGVLL